MTHTDQQTITTLLLQMTLDEKIRMLSGRDFWSTETLEHLAIPSITLTDGPHGIRKQPGTADHLGQNPSLPATCFPTASTLACSFDPVLARDIGGAMATEALALGVSVILGPGINLKRSPLCGRNFEYFSEDPLLTAQMAIGMIDGIQEQGVAACPKHFAVNNQETRRMTIDAIVDEQTLRDVYLRPFQLVIEKAQPACLMTAYNRINGHYASEHPILLKSILRQEWDYDGVVLSDWGGTSDRVKALLAGLDLEMPGSDGFHDVEIDRAVKEGILDEAVIDGSIRRLLRLAGHTAPLEASERPPHTGHHELARRAAVESIVLAKNDRQLLPITGDKPIAVIGAMAIAPRYQGAGSSKINPMQLDQPLDALKKAGLDVTYAPGYRLDRDKKDAEQTTRALRLAAERDLVLFFCGLPDHYESEGFDRKHLLLPTNQIQLLEALLEVNPNTVVLYLGGGPVATDWIDRVHTLMILYLGGEALGSALADLITGRENPSGRLAETWFRQLSDIPSTAHFPGGRDRVHYREGPYIGYAGAREEVCFSFGHGLSYTTFSHGKPLYRDRGASRSVLLTVENTGVRRGSESLLLFARQLTSRGYGFPRQLVGFQKTRLDVGASAEVEIQLAEDAFHRYDPSSGQRIEAGGRYLLEVGGHRLEILHPGPELITSTDAALAEWIRSPGDGSVPDPLFEEMLGRKPPPLTEKRHGSFDENTLLQDIGVTPFGRLLRGLVHFAMLLAVSGSLHTRRMLSAMAMDLPLRSLGLMGGAFFTQRRLQGIIDLLNGKQLAGWGKILFTKPPRR